MAVSFATDVTHLRRGAPLGVAFHDARHRPTYFTKRTQLRKRECDGVQHYASIASDEVRLLQVS